MKLIRPEQRLCSAVVNQAVKDACMTPLGGNRKVKVVRPVAVEAFREVFAGHLDGYMTVAGIMPIRFKKHLLEYMWSDRQEDEFGLYNEQRRACFRWNARQILKLRHVKIPNIYRQKIGESY